MARRGREHLPQPLDRSWFDWPFRPFGAWRGRLDDDEVKVDEFVEEGELVVRADLPGVDPEHDVDVSIVDGSLCIRAERRYEEKVERREYRRSEIRYGSFSRVLPLPPNAKESDIKASYKDGILEVRAPIDGEASRPSKIAVNRS